MAATLNSLFPFSTLPQNGVTINPTMVEFEAPVIAGKYVFSSATTPPKSFGSLMKGQAGLIAGVMISANCTPADFAANCDKLEMRVLHGGNLTPVNMGAFPFSTFQAGDNFQVNFEITGGDKLPEEEIYIEIAGTVSQIANMNENVLRLKIAFNYYRAPAEFLK